MHLSALADGQILTILSYLVDLRVRPRNSHKHDDKKQKKEQDRFERRFKRLFPHSHAQMLDEKTMRREILRPARELYTYSLVCKQFRDVIANPAHENLLYSGVTESLMKEYQLLDCGPDVEDALIDRDIFIELFKEKNQEMLHRTGVPVRIQHDNHDLSKGFWHGPTAEALKTSKNAYWYGNLKPDEDVTYSTVIISDQDRAAYLRLLKTGFRENRTDMKYDSHIFQDPRFDFYILMLEGTPKPAIQKYREFAQFIDNKLLLLRSVLTVDGSSPPLPFHTCLEWCNDMFTEFVEEDIGEEIGEFVEPTMDRVLDSIVCWAVHDFKEGCSHYIARSVLFDSEIGVGRGRQGWDNWVVCGGTSEYFVPYMIMEVDKEYWP
jgi:hypothetical protein